MDTFIKAENLGKKYIIGHQKQRYGDSLRDAMTHTARGIWQRVRHPLSPNRESVDLEELWALKDIDFEVKQGERVGIIGRNGAGKSTLLKILSRITEPTTGKVRIKGRVSSLLEVGTGFHPELTGRENIFLNGAILGMTRQEVKRKFDEIIAFAELEKFLDTPVKRYSSGMYVRLAFAVAAHLEPEILLVDEVLAVGDVAFQKKCLGKMGQVAQEGRTVLFVSHNMGAITSLCPKAIWLDKGCIVKIDKASDIVSSYIADTNDTSGEVRFAPKESKAFFTSVSVLDGDGRCANAISVQSAFTIRLEYAIQKAIESLEISFSVWKAAGSKVFYCPRSMSESNPLEPGNYHSDIHIPAFFLAPGTYNLTAGLHIPKIRLYDSIKHEINFNIIETGSPHYALKGQDIGLVLVNFPWQTYRKGQGNMTLQDKI